MEGQQYEERGLGPWIRRNPWLLMRLFTVIVFSFAASTVAANFSYGLEGEPTVLSIDQLNSGRLPAGTEIGDYVRVSGTPDVGENLTRVGVPESRIAVVSLYETAYFYFRLMIRRQPSYPDHAGPPQRSSEFGRARLERQARDSGDRHLPRHYPEGARERRSSPRREHTGRQYWRDARVSAQDLPRLLGHNRPLAPLHSLAGLEEEQTAIRSIAFQRVSTLSPSGFACQHVSFLPL